MVDIGLDDGLACVEMRARQGFARTILFCEAGIFNYQLNRMLNIFVEVQLKILDDADVINGYADDFLDGIAMIKKKSHGGASYFCTQVSKISSSTEIYW